MEPEVKVSAAQWASTLQKSLERLSRVAQQKAPAVISFVRGLKDPGFVLPTRPGAAEVAELLTLMLVTAAQVRALVALIGPGVGSSGLFDRVAWDAAVAAEADNLFPEPKE